MFNQLYYHSDKAYLIKRKIPLHNFLYNGELKMEFVKGWMKWLGCDHVLKTNTHYIFVNSIQDIEFEEIDEEIAK